MTDTALQFTLSAPLTHLDEIYLFLYNNKEKYHIHKILVACEDDPKEHFHIVVVYGQNLDQSWNIQNAIVKVLVEKYKLRKNQHGGKVMYTNGKKKGTINNIDNTLAYVLKQKLDVQYYGFTDKEISEARERSFVKNKEDTLDYQKLLKDKIFKLWEEDFPNPPNSNEQDKFQNFPVMQEIINFYEGDKKLRHDAHYKQVEVIQKFVFSKLVEEDKPIKSFAQVKSITRYIIQYSTNYYILQNRFELFKSNN